MTFDEILADVYRRLNKASTPDAQTAIRIKAFVNQRYRELLTLPDCAQFRDTTLTMATVADQSRYVFPQAVAQVHRMWSAATEDVLTEETMGWYRQMVPDPALQTGTPLVYCVEGIARVAVQPSAAGQTLFVKSTSASDVNTCRVEFVTTAGVRQTASVTMTGVTAIQLGTLAAVSVENFYLSAVAVGTVTLTTVSGAGTTLATIPIGATMPRYTAFYLWPTPSAIDTLSMDASLEITDLAQSTDEPRIPPDFHRLLIYGACVDECLKTQDPNAGTFKQEWAQGRDALLYWIHARQSYRPGSVVSRGNNLGSAYPVGRW